MYSIPRCKGKEGEFFILAYMVQSINSKNPSCDGAASKKEPLQVNQVSSHFTKYLCEVENGPVF